MPVYEYECGECKKIFEIQQRIADAPVSVCPECGGNVKKLISMSSFQLKGGGWYADGYSSFAGKAACADTGSAPSCSAGSGGSCCQCPAAN
ncbi:MAG: zinc ribbon domain-containing protein [Desulfobulbus sp.]|nr:zinc ribbon domain-containing protein [Desulfobulbus sp.]